ncbi:MULTISPECIES: OmpP1/FadL family transporter [Burkholderia]|uniref:OmpP1/FadL family transporter n=1 Tax=Burkholderia TaxID=32008 RepID=UPI00158C83C2|nr:MULTISPECIES: outer membrane protein transport protein [Burkholderia]MBH9643941.1 outer membrane protein transport protein [Burkholderia vietnamiensis]MBR8150660.1 outer membrane protein transport protein [Burkholderia vietnamiensis]MCA8184501.1 outer membrane protein transport protein [Burkholderia vietnamiensis]MDN8072851.1 outer membrane protein transport protein [Burkholderia vietnamiensis]MDN8112757.1 outer membrane protein transport protein [Burkholderia vietnamiensis]
MKLQGTSRALLAVVAAIPGLAWATNGYFSNGYGVASQGMAGVGIGLPQDALSAAANPAGIAFVGNRFDGDISLFLPKRGAEISGNGFGADGSYAGNNRSIFALPEFAVTYQVLPNTYAGLALYANGGLDTGYARNPYRAFGATGSAGVDLEQLFLSPTIAYKLLDRHAFGIGLNIAYQRFTASGLQPFTGMSVAPGNATDRGADSTVGVGVHLGYTGEITPTLTVGVTWASKIHGRFDKYKGLFADGGSFDIPENYGIGLSWKVTPAWTVAADFQRILYGNVKSIANPLANLFLGNTMGSSNGPAFGWRNTNVIKIGTSYDVTSHLTHRAGYSHSSQPVASTETFLNVLAQGVVQDQATLGSTWKTDAKTSFGVFYGHAFKKTVDGNNSIPAAFGGGNANLHLAEDVVGVSFGKSF